MGVLPTALGRNAGYRALKDFQQRLLYALTAHVPRDGGILALAGNLIDFVDIDNAPLCQLNVEVCRLNQSQEDVFHILAHIARLGEAGCVRNGEGHVEDLRQRLRKEGLAAAGGAYHQDVGLLQLHIILVNLLVDALVVVVDGNAQRALCLLLTHHILIQHILHVRGSGQALRAGCVRHQGQIIRNDHIGACHKPPHLILRFSAEAAPMQRTGIARGKFVSGH